jgi:micrococcal nuclease
MGIFFGLLKLLSPSSRRSLPKAPVQIKSPWIRGARIDSALQTSVPKIQEARRRQVIRGPCWVIDGDTIVINRIHIRLAGIDAPELDQPYGHIAKGFLMGLCRGQVVSAIPEGGTSYERFVATCRLDDGRDLSAEMVQAGLALDWAKYSGGQYRHLEVAGVRQKLWRVEAKHRGRMPIKDKFETSVPSVRNHRPEPVAMIQVPQGDQ